MALTMKVAFPTKYRTERGVLGLKCFTVSLNQNLPLNMIPAGPTALATNSETSLALVGDGGMDSRFCTNN